MATTADGNRRKATANSVTAARRSAERRKCPMCGRKSAVVTEMQDWGDRIVIVRTCRWHRDFYPSHPMWCAYEEVTTVSGPSDTDETGSGRG